MTTTRDQILMLATDKFGVEFAARAAKGEQLFINHHERRTFGGALAEIGDSLDRMEFVMLIEDHFILQIPDALTVDVKTLDDLVKLVDGLRSQPKHGAK